MKIVKQIEGFLKPLAESSEQVASIPYIDYNGRKSSYVMPNGAGPNSVVVNSTAEAVSVLDAQTASGATLVTLTANKIDRGYIKGAMAVDRLSSPVNYGTNNRMYLWDKDAGRLYPLSSNPVHPIRYIAVLPVLP